MRVVVKAVALLGLLERAVNGGVADRDFGDLAAANQGLELAVGDLAAGRRQEYAWPTASSVSTPSTHHMAVGARRRRSGLPPGGGRECWTTGHAPCGLS